MIQYLQHHRVSYTNNNHVLVLNAHCSVIIYKFSQKKKDITIILYSATIYVHKIPNPFSLTRENVGRSQSSVTIKFVRCPLLITGCHGAPVSTSSIHRSGLICAAREGKDVICIIIGKGRTPLAEILVER